MNFKPLGDRAKWVIAALVVIALLDVVAVWADWDRISLLDRILNGEPVTIHEADASDHRQQVIGILQLIALVGGAVFFIRWFLQAYRNVPALGGERRYGESWAGFAWFVPILNLWRPKQIANDIWRASDPDRPHETPGPSAPVSGFLTLWWIFWLASAWASQVAGRLTFSGNTARDLRNASTAFLVGDSIDIVAAALAIWVIIRIGARQQLRADKRAAAS